MNALERDLVAWTKARLRLDAAVMGSHNEAPVRYGSLLHAELISAEARARSVILRRGVRLIAAATKGQGSLHK